jgi:hypothetical protein
MAINYGDDELPFALAYARGYDRELLIGALGHAQGTMGRRL